MSSLDTGQVAVGANGQPLLTAAQAHQILGIRPRTVYEWRRREYIAIAGLNTDGIEVYDAAVLARVRDTPRQRKRVQQQPRIRKAA